MKSNNGSFFADLYRSVGERLGLLAHGEQSAAKGRSEADIRDALLAVEEIRRFQLEMRKKGVSRAEVRRWINEGRRA